MRITEQLASGLREVLLDGTWVSGTNIRNEIQGLDWITATKKFGTHNSIADLVFHMDYYLAGVLHFFKTGELLISDQQSFTYEPLRSQEEWDELVNKFCRDAENFVAAVAQLNDQDLEKIFVKKAYGTYFRNLMVMSEHCYYHLGQIVLIKKLLKQL